MRLFRKTIIKDKWVNMKGKKYHFWKNQKKREETQDFFTNGPYTFDEQTYRENEAIFFKLVHNTVEDDFLKCKFRIEFDEFTEVLKKAFGNSVKIECL